MKLLKASAKNKVALSKKLTGSKPILILYFAEWCGHCIEFKPIWEAIIRKLETFTWIHIVEAESSNIQHLPKKHQAIQAFPTINIINNGKATEYSGFRVLDGVMNFVNQYKPLPKKNIKDKAH